MLELFLQIQSCYLGTGKTTSLIHLARKNSALKFLYLCYNKSVQECAQKVFGSNVKCQTFHSLAFRTAGLV